MRIRRTRAPLTALAALAVLLSGCSGSDDDGNGGSGSEEQESPLSEYLSAVYGGDLSPEEQEREFAEQQEQSEELVAACMQEQGFEYTPVTQTGSYSSSVEYEPDDREWVSQYGYGAVHGPYEDEPVPEEEYVDPNEDYVASLSESEQAAFYEALYGPGPDEEEMAEGGESEYEYDWTTAGCQGAAQHEVAGEDLSQSEEFRSLFEAINELYESMSSWPGLAELDAEWAACMDAAGHGGHESPADAQESIYDELNAVYENIGMSEDGSPTGEPDQAAIDAIGEREVELALADLDCREETDYTDRTADATRELEEQFIEDHQAELDALLAAAEQN